MGIQRPHLRAENGGLAVDFREFYDPNDTVRPAVDLAMPTEEEVRDWHLAPELGYPEGAKDLRRIDITCIGTGLGGITVAMLAQWRLKNVHLKVFEKNPKNGGTWNENKYPGCRCDLASHFYSWRFELNDWTAEYSEADEIERYFTRIGDKYNLDAFTTYNAEVIGLTWSEERQAWRVDVRTPEGVKTDWSHVVVNASGFLNNVKDFKFPGEELFKGPVMHTARFNRNVQLEGKVVAVIGNGSSGIQTIGTIGHKVKELHSYQRQNTYIIAQVTPDGQPHIDVHVYTPEEREKFKDRKYNYEFYRGNFQMMDNLWSLFVKDSPESEAATKGALALMEKLVPDPKVRETLTPSYPLGCRRLTPHEHYLDVLQLPTTTIVRGEIERFTADGIVSGGVERKCDVIIKAIGFDMNYIPRFPVVGRGGITLAELWKEYPWSYKSMCNHGFPNLFPLMGVNAPVASQSIHILEEAQMQYVIQVVRRMQTTDEVSYEPKKEAEEQWHDGIQERLKPTVWSVECGGWYKHKSGIICSHYPGRSLEYLDELKEPIWSDFLITRLSDMVDPKANEIREPVFGADVEKVAKSRPSRMPELPKDREEELSALLKMLVA
ncbi:hypothetical protein DFJ74DRAFT_658763 [Hyaloraphidium curvatum]|nr:hypothetical protein DFJ74DRAFT_658763 [Hyaloraphidium curvatum]